MLNNPWQFEQPECGATFASGQADHLGTAPLRGDVLKAPMGI
jgi:hypothetical protein